MNSNSLTSRDVWYMDVQSSGVGSYMTSVTFDPKILGIRVANTKKSGMLLTWMQAKRRRK